jgi:hypothetical protein
LRISGNFVYDDANPENPLGPRPFTTANGGRQLIPNADAFLLAWQVGAKFSFPKNLYAQIAPALYNYTGNGDTFNIHFQGGDPRLSNSAFWRRTKPASTACSFSICQWKLAGNLATSRCECTPISR